MEKPFPEIMSIMDEVSKNNRVWHTRDAEVGDLRFTFELSAEQRKREEKRDQDMAHMSIIWICSRSTSWRIQKKCGDQVLEKPGGFRNYNSGNQGYTSENQGRNYQRDGQYDRPGNR
ncbi:hypothetical protein KY285_001086 [Solanum tuberosum]|nr:hypothetical protein KY289_001328 [Solanum tuberosum]KAH0765215.1 hypothetical protein KY285_001086 [Solanum tuberosum]